MVETTAITKTEAVRLDGVNVPLDVLRAIAALAVVLQHVRTLVMMDFDDVAHNPMQSVLYGVSALGHQAVVLFFVLSGFWVGGSLIRSVQRNTFRWSGYMVNRITRLGIVLMPALVLTMVLDLIGRHYFGDMSTYRGDLRYGGVALDQRPIDAGTFLGNAVFLMAIKVPTYGTNTALWSLSFEFWMYVLAPLVLFGVYFWTRSKYALIYTAGALAVAMLIGPRAVSYVPLWMLGAVVAAFGPRLIGVLNSWSNRRVATARVLTGGLTLVASMVVRGLNSLPEMVGDLIVAVPAAAFIATLLTGLLGRGLFARLLTRFSSLAHSSYSLYAIHLPIAFLVVSVFGVQVDSRWPSDPVHWVYMLAIIVGIVAAAWLFAQVTERHTTRARKYVSDRLHASSLQR
ncbi:acyltransferase [Arthrobacter sp. KBS0703]|uniref:acyltransferase family protein n=1 Tax=Arthrobacter sp. KBS0703 TaxID=1955698 RepID=UPI00098E9584|nr:acyltransferase [Arthrobacter sp. KBS0703]TSE14731.1 acyltransferase [Arthrobacter sp. KBS0703]